MGVVDPLAALEPERERQGIGEVFGGCWHEGVGIIWHRGSVAGRQEQRKNPALGARSRGT